MSARGRGLLRIAIAPLVLATMVGPASGGGGPPSHGGGMPPRPVLLAPVAEETVRDEIEATGSVDPFLLTVVASEAEGRVEEILFREGDDIPSAAVPLAKLVDEERALRLAAAEARAVSATEARKTIELGEREETIDALREVAKEQETRLEQAEDDSKRMTALTSGDRPVIDLAKADAARREVTAARARLAAARHALARAEKGPRPEEIERAKADEREAAAQRDLAALELARCAVATPVAGRVVRLRTEVGQWIQRGGPVAEIADLSTVLVTVGVGERDLPLVSKDASVVVTVDAWPDRAFAGKVLRLVPAADPTSRAFPVRILVDNAAEGAAPGRRPLEAGMYARARIAVGAPRKALLVPADAVVVQGREAAVFTVEGAQAKRIAVVRGPARGARVEVKGEGLAAGAAVIVTGNEGLRGSEPVMPVGPPAPPSPPKPPASPPPTAAPPAQAPTPAGTGR